MPLYDYQCRACGKVAEVRHGFNETYEEPCAECKGEMKRVYSPVGIAFKGSGFYVNDSRKSGESSGSKSGSSSKSVPAKTDGSSSEGASTSGGSSATADSSSSASAPAGGSSSESAA